MKTKNFEKLASFHLENEKLGNVLGGKGAPVQNFISVEGTTTGGGTISFPEEGGCVCYAYTSDIDLPGGGRGYNGSHKVDDPC